MPEPVENWAQIEGNRLIVAQLEYDLEEQANLAQPRIASLNAEQHSAFDKIMHSVRENDPKLFFLDGAGGTGKTHVYNTLCYTLRGEGMIVLCVASSGIAALLLMGLRTSHSTFKILVKLHEEVLCGVKKGTHLAELLSKVRLIIWDEVLMQDRRCAESVDRTIQDTRSDPRPYGGEPVVYGGDFQQTLPTVLKALTILVTSREYMFNASETPHRLPVFGFLIAVFGFGIGWLCLALECGSHPKYSQTEFILHLPIWGECEGGRTKNVAFSAHNLHLLPFLEHI
jgi:hypothetical protein